MNSPATVSWEAQLRYFGRRYRAIAYNARGYPPSDVPDDVERYSQDRARNDIRAVLDALSIDTAHVVGLSMGGFAALHFGFTYPARARSLVVGGCGYGAEPDKRRSSPRRARRRRGVSRRSTWPRPPRPMRSRPRACSSRTRIPAAGGSSSTIWRGIPPAASALTLRGVQGRRPSLYDLVDRMKEITAPTLVMTGDEDWPCLEPALLMKRTIKSAALVVMPNTGHTLNLEEPAAFNARLDRFFQTVDAGAGRSAIRAPCRATFWAGDQATSAGTGLTAVSTTVYFALQSEAGWAMRDLDKALADITAIRSQMARGAEFRGYGPATVAATGRSRSRPP